MNLLSKVALGGIGVVGTSVSSSAIYVNSRDFTIDIGTFVSRSPFLESLDSNSSDWSTKISEYRDSSNSGLFFPEHKGLDEPTVSKRKAVEVAWLKAKCNEIRTHKSTNFESFARYEKWCTTKNRAKR